MKKQRPSSLLSDGFFLLWRRIELGAVNGPEMAFCVQKRGAALSSVSMLSGLVEGGGGGEGTFCFIERPEFYALRREEILPI